MARELRLELMHAHGEGFTLGVQLVLLSVESAVCVAQSSEFRFCPGIGENGLRLARQARELRLQLPHTRRERFPLGCRSLELGAGVAESGGRLPDDVRELGLAQRELGLELADAVVSSRRPPRQGVARRQGPPARRSEAREPALLAALVAARRPRARPKACRRIRRRVRDRSGSTLRALETEADAVLGLQQAAVLLRERVRHGAGRDVTELDEELAQRPARALLLGECMLERLGAEQALFDHQPSELSTVALGGIHGVVDHRAVVSRHLALIGRSAGSLKRGMLAAQARSPASVQSTNASQWTPITSVCRPSASTAANAAASQAQRGAEPRSSARFQATKSAQPEQARLDAELGVRRLARLDLDAGPLGGHAGVAEPVALRVADHGLDPVAQVRPVAGDRRLARR